MYPNPGLSITGRSMFNSDAHLTRQALRPDASTSNNAPRQAPSIPKDVTSRRDEPRFLQYRAKMMSLNKDTDGGLAGLLEKVKEWAAQAPSTESPHLRDKRTRVMEKYELTVLAVCPTMDVNDLWLDTTIRQYTAIFLHLVQCTRGRNSEHITATTLLHTGRMFAYCVAKYCRNKDGEATGMRELCQGGLFRYIENFDAYLIDKYKLERFISTEKPRFGKLEVLLLIREALKNTETYGPCRIVAIQRIIICLISFFTGVRPSTLGPSHKDYKTQGKFMRLQDVRIFTTGKPLQFRVILRTNAYKGHNGTVGQERRIVFNPVQNWYNLAFDVSLYIVMHLFARKALKGIKDFDTLRKFKGSEIPIEDAKKLLPFLLAMDPGGRNLKEDEPIMAKAVSASFRTLCRNAYMPPCGTYATRRGLADYYNTVMGQAAAELVLGHFRPGCLNSYVRGVEGIDMVGHALEELPEALSPNVKHALELHSIHSVAVTAMVALFHSEQHSPLQTEGTEETGTKPVEKSKTGSEITNNVKLTEGQMLEIELLPEMCELLDAAAKALENFKALYENTRSKAGVKYDSIGQLHNFIKASTLRSDVDEETVEKVRQEAKDAAEALRKKRQLLRKRAVATIRRGQEETRQATELGTFDERAKARQMLQSQNILALGRSANPPDVRSRILGLRDEQLNEIRSLPEKERIARLESQEEEEDEGNEEVDKDPRLKNILAVIHAKSTAAARRHSEDDNDDDDNEQTVSSTIDNVPFEECHPSTPCQSSGSSKPPLRLVVRDLSYQEHEETVPDNIIPCNDEQVRVALWHMLMAPVAVSQEIDSMVAAESKKDKRRAGEKTYICEQCLAFKHDSTRSKRLWTRGHLQRHLLNQHTEWDNLELKMVIGRTYTSFKCPSKACNFKASSIPKVRRHCVESKQCPERSRFRDMKARHVMREKYMSDENIQRPRVKTKIVLPTMPVLPLESRLEAFCKNKVSALGYADLLHLIFC
ncbi:uncharacterized protein ARMOST_15569 [Armillaria ostoyae]|uniref:Uncharacterized protein n=1 Tax=Armillaria ostoyae TaxID=47428 RepID=A0A284RTP5_ARMOS|nr:uncharacterized protein ARMOST_15569 [Armillaria ostoyae]